MSVEYRVGDVFDQLAHIPDGAVDLIVTSPPFLALRSYLPDGHPDKAKEIGSEPTPAEFLDTMLALSAEWGRVLTPHGSLCVELGDTYSGAGPGATTTDRKWSDVSLARRVAVSDKLGPGWPLAKSLTGIPTLYPWSLAYGRNLLTGIESPAGQWRIRNVIVWARPNPPVGALGDKFRPATSYITVACKGQRRYFDLDAVRGGFDQENPHNRVGPDGKPLYRRFKPGGRLGTDGEGERGASGNNPAGAPPLDWHSDMPDEDGDWLWKLATQPYKGSHYATFPLTLPNRLIEAMCPLRVCCVCGQPSERIVDRARVSDPDDSGRDAGSNVARLGMKHAPERGWEYDRSTVGWSDCGHDAWRTGIVLDPFAGSGTTLEAAQAVGRHAIGIDLDHRNADLARERVGMFLEVAGG